MRRSSGCCGPVERTFAWPEFVADDALQAFSTDAPTAPFEALPNIYVAATRMSALDPSFAVRTVVAGRTEFEI